MADTDKNSFKLYLDYKDIFDELSDEQAGQIIKAIFAHETGEECALAGVLRAVFAPIRNQLDRNRTQYEETCEKNRKNGALGGRPPKNQQDIDETQNNRPVNLGCGDKPKKPDTETDTDTDTDTIHIDDDKSTTAPDARTRELDHLIRSYTENIGEPDDQIKSDLAALLDKHGFFPVWNFTCRAGKQSPKPDNPIAYITALINRAPPESGTVQFKIAGGGVQ